MYAFHPNVFGLQIQVSSDPCDLVMTGHGTSACLLHVYLDSCKDLAQKGAKVPSPMVEMRVGGGGEGCEHTSWPQQHTQDPVFQQGFVFLVNRSVSNTTKIQMILVLHGV